MAEQSAGDRTEKATPERLRKAREEGRIPQSQEVPSAMAIGLLVIALGVGGPALYHWFIEQMRDGLTFHLTGSLQVDSFRGLMQSRMLAALGVMAPFLLAATMASVLGSVLTSGWSFSAKGLRLDLSRLSPMKGLKSLFSARSAVSLVVSLAKLAVMLTIAWNYLAPKIDTLMGLYWARPEGIVTATSQIVLGLSIRLAIGFAVIALADLIYQRWNYLRDMRMTRQEVKEEGKQHEMPVEVRSRMRAIRAALARKRMLKRVRTADVVVVNPTHVAVAMKYDAALMAAPIVVAKGADLVCEKMKEIARAHNVPVVEKPELARVLYATVEIDHPVPEALYVAVAEIIALIYRLRGKRRLQGTHA